ncbi:MAG: Fic family protein [Rhodospirillales bacterium]
MIIYELTESESDPAYKALHVSNIKRHYNFLLSAIEASLDIDRPFLSQTVIKALNYHAIACLHTHAGEYRPCPVSVVTPKGRPVYEPPDNHRVPALMDDMVNQVNRMWDQVDPVFLAAYVLWRINYIHPFINGNGRTARAAAYFVLCVRRGGPLPGKKMLPELIGLPKNRAGYERGLRAADKSFERGDVDLTRLSGFVAQLLDQQLKSAKK